MTSAIESPVVFFNNISPDTTEVDLYPLFQEAGHVKSVRIKRDRETNASMGFGFCEYMDIPSAKAALRTVAGRPINGKAIKLDLADTAKSKRDLDMNDQDPTRMRLPGGNAIQAALNNVHVAEVYEAVAQLRALAMEQPDVARKILSDNPQMSLAVLYTLQHMGVIPSEIPDEAFVVPDGVAVPEGVRTHVAPSSVVAAELSKQCLQMMASLTSDQLKKIQSLTPRDIQGMAPALQPQMIAIQRHLAEMANQS